MRRLLQFGLSVLFLLIFLFSVVASSIAGAQSSAAASTDLSAEAQKIAVAGISNAGKINDFLFRGAQPSKQGLAQLKELGVTTIVDFRGWGHEVESERRQAESLGLRFISIPLGGWSTPTSAQIAQFFVLLRSSPGQKIFVHCKYGEDRTGVMVAAYRIGENHWSAQQAIEEMYFFGFHYHWHPGMESFVRKFPASFANDPTFAPLRQAALK
jgi:protein tyrosine/serine phosphatase